MSFYSSFFNYTYCAGRVFKVGHLYYKGIGVEKGKHKAFIYCQRSAKIGTLAKYLLEFELKRMNIMHSSIIENLQKFGCYNVDVVVIKRIEVKKDKHKAFVYYQKSTEIGTLVEHITVGRHYDEKLVLKR